MSQTRRSLYRIASILGDVEAAEKGPGAYAKRLVRRRVYRSNGRLLRYLLRTVGLGFVVIATISACGSGGGHKTAGTGSTSTTGTSTSSSSGMAADPMPLLRQTGAAIPPSIKYGNTDLGGGRCAGGENDQGDEATLPDGAGVEVCTEPDQQEMADYFQKNPTTDEWRNIVVGPLASPTAVVIVDNIGTPVSDPAAFDNDVATVAHRVGGTPVDPDGRPIG